MAFWLKIVFLCTCEGLQVSQMFHSLTYFYRIVLAFQGTQVMNKLKCLACIACEFHQIVPVEFRYDHYSSWKVVPSMDHQCKDGLLWKIRLSFRILICLVICLQKIAFERFMLSIIMRRSPVMGISNGSQVFVSSQRTNVVNVPFYLKCWNSWVALVLAQVTKYLNGWFVLTCEFLQNGSMRIVFFLCFCKWLHYFQMLHFACLSLTV